MILNTEDVSHSGAREDELDALRALHGRIVDTLAGFDKMVEAAEPSFRPTAAAFQKLHRSHAEQVAHILGKAGGSPDQDGSIMGVVNRVVVATRAMFDMIDADVLAQIRSGEEYVLNSFDDTIDHTADGHRVAQLRTMRRELVDVLATTDAKG